MTLILSVNGPKTIWMLADRRLSSEGTVVREDASKIMDLGTTDGFALVGNAGLGATQRWRTQPAEWMVNVLRGRGDLSLPQSVRVLAETIGREFPYHLRQMAGDEIKAHKVLVSSFWNGKPVLTTIDLVLTPERQPGPVYIQLHITKREGRPRTVTKIGLAGTGGAYLYLNKKLPGDRIWRKELLTLVRAHDHGRTSSHAVADYLAQLNFHVHKAVIDGSVGPRCIVAWRPRREKPQRIGGGHQPYTGTSRDKSWEMLPTVTTGTDLTALIRSLNPIRKEMMEAVASRRPVRPFDLEEINRRAAKLPDQPDEKLR